MDPRPDAPDGRLGDVVLGLGACLVVAVVIWADVGGARQPNAYAYLFAAGLGLLMLVRRTAPVLVLVASSLAVCAYYAADYPVIGLALPVGAALFSAAEQGRLRWALGVAAALTAVACAFRLAEGEDGGIVVYDTVATAALMLAFVALGDGRRSRRLWQVEVQERLARAERERDLEAQRAVGEERARIARDLHDSLAHTVSVISLHSEVAAQDAGDLGPGGRVALENVQQAAAAAMDELRRTLGLLRDPDDVVPRSPTPGLVELPGLLGSVRSAGLTVTFAQHGTGDGLGGRGGSDEVVSDVVGGTAYRVVQEALTNVVRHARAERVEVVLDHRPGWIDVTVRDDGVGPDPTGGTGRGLLGMRERVLLVGGSLTVGAADRGRGFEVVASLPLAAR